MNPYHPKVPSSSKIIPNAVNARSDSRCAGLGRGQAQGYPRHDGHSRKQALAATFLLSFPLGLLSRLRPEEP